jgi:hypothetical protein
MPLKLTNQATAAVVMQRLDKTLGINEKGEVTLGFVNTLDTCADILSTVIGFSTQVVEMQRRAITRRAVIDAKKTGNFSINAILGNVEKQQKAYLVRPIRRFVLLTSASFQFLSGLRTIRLNGDTLAFFPKRPANSPLPDGGSIILRDTTPHGYSYIKAYVSARDPYEAVDLAFQRVDQLRGIWNFFLNLRTGFRLSLGATQHKPVNRILPGPLHTLHFPDGKLALEDQWLHTPLVKNLITEDITHYYTALRRFEKLIRNKLARCNFRDNIIGFLIRYARALDEPYLITSFLRLWALLEEMTGTLKASYEVTVRRAAFVFKNSQYARIVLDYLREQRNRMVHKDPQLDNIERLTYELKNFVEALLRFLVVESGKFPDLQAFHSLLDLPPDSKLLRSRIRQHELAYKLHGR